MVEKQYSVYLRTVDCRALDHVRRQLGVKSSAEVIRAAIHGYARSLGWEPEPVDAEQPEAAP